MPVARTASATPPRRWWEGFTAPVFAPMVRDRRWAAVFSSVAIVQVAAGYVGFRTFDCPMKSGIGIDCPGCGLSRACGALLHGNWGDWMALHALAPFFLVGAVVMCVSLVLPPGRRERFVAWIDHMERRTRISQCIIALTVVYWIARLGYATVFA